MHRIVNGIKIECTPQEEAEIKADWERNILRMEEKRQKKLLKKEQKQAIRNKVMNSLNLSEEEINLILP